MPKTAFLILRSPQEQDPVHMMERFADRTEAAAILVEDGVYHALLDRQAEALGNAADEILVSSEDLEARGFGPSDLKVGRAAGYPEIVDCIMERTERSVTV
jgi:sulfur relay protein TusB/DsrH